MRAEHDLGVSIDRPSQCVGMEGFAVRRQKHCLVFYSQVWISRAFQQIWNFIISVKFGISKLPNKIGISELPNEIWSSVFPNE